MHLLKINYRLIIIILISYMVFSCDDFLIENDPSNFSLETYYTEPQHAESAILAIYESLYPIHDSQSWLMLEFKTGLANTNVTADAGYANNQVIRDLQNTSDHPSLNTFWVSHYRGIANANVALEKIPEIQMDETDRNNLLAEARFLRAYYYFNLVRIFGDVPLIDEIIDLGDPKMNSERMPIEDIYDLIVTDLRLAEDSDLPFNTESGRVTIGAIKSLLSDVYLAMAGYPLEKGDEYYQLAMDKAAEVINSNEYSLFESYDDLHDPNTDNTGEYIFMVQFESNERPSNSLQQGLVPARRGISEYSAELGLIFARSEFVESYEDGDKRKEEEEFYFSKFTLQADRSDTVDLGNFHIFKHFDKDAHLNTARSGLNWQVIRYADVLLNYAEASNEIFGPSPEALEAVNKIRRRAELPEYSGLTQNEFRESIWKERWYELSFEGKIWFDMVRLRKAFNVTTKEFEDYVGHTFVNGATLGERELLFPLPTSEIRNNENLTQNPGY